MLHRQRRTNRWHDIKEKPEQATTETEQEIESYAMPSRLDAFLLTDDESHGDVLDEYGSWFV